MDVDFVIISYECNFWGMAALDALVNSLETARIHRAIYVVHNYKSTAQIHDFRAHCRPTTRPDSVIHAVAYDGLFEQVANYADFTQGDVDWLIARHGMVLNWLIKYWLPDGRYLFIDHDCIVRPGFVQWLTGVYSELAGQLFVFPRHYQEPRSLTGPMFYCDTAVRALLTHFCDIGWMSGLVCEERGKLRGGSEVFYTDAQFEKAITRDHFDDTLHNVVRHILARRAGLVSKFSTVDWLECDHVWHGATRHLKRAQVAMVRMLMAERFRSEYFHRDVTESNLLKEFLMRLDECGLGEEFRERFLMAAAEVAGRPKSQPCV